MSTKILKQFVDGGLLKERIYAPSGDRDGEEDEDEEDKDSNGMPITHYDDAKIDPAMGQSIPAHIADRNNIAPGGLDPQQQSALPDPSNPSGSDANQDEEPSPDEPAEDAEPDAEEGEGSDEEAPPEEEPDADAAMAPGMDPGIFLRGLCHMLQSASHFAQGMADHKDQFIAKYGDDKLPILNEVIHKVTTAEQMLSQFADMDAAGEGDEEGEGTGEEEAPEDGEASDGEADAAETDADTSDTDPDDSETDSDTDNEDEKDKPEETESEEDCHTFDSDTGKCLDEPDEFVGLESRQPKKRPGFLNINFGRRRS